MDLVLGWLKSVWIFISPSVLTVAFLGGVAVTFRDTIGGWLTARTKHQYDAELERIRSEGAKATEEVRAVFSRELEALKAELAAKGKEVEALRSATLGTRGARQAQIDKRRLEAIDQLWRAVCDLSPIRAAADWLVVIKFDSAAARAQTDTRVRDMFDMLAKGWKIDQPITNDGRLAKPFVSALAWGLFSSYTAVIASIHGQIAVLRTGVGADLLASSEQLNALLIEALPDWKQVITITGNSGFPAILDELEKRLLEHVQLNPVHIQPLQNSVRTDRG